MPVGQPTFVQDAHENVAQVTRVGQVKVSEVFDALKPSYHESMTAASGGTQLADVPVGKLYIQSLSGNGIMYVGGIDTDAPFSGRGIMLKSDDINPNPLELPISNANKVRICATVSGQLVSYWGFINSDNVTLDPARQGVAPDAAPPVFLSSIPYSGASNININNVTFYGYFNEPLAPASVNTSSVIVRNSGAPETDMVDGNVALFTNIAAFQPTVGELQYNSWYTAYFTPLITDVAGNAMVNSASFTFLTMQAPDTSGPVYLSSLPIDGVSGVATNNLLLRAYFHEPLAPTSINISSFIVRLSGAAESTKVSGVTAQGFDTNTAEIRTNSGQLAFASWYNAYVTPLITDVLGNTMVNSASFSFLTAGAPDTVPPVFLSSDPINNFSGVQVNNTQFLAYFNEPIQATSVDISSFMIRLSGAAQSTKASGTAQLANYNNQIAVLQTNSGQLAFTSWYNAYITPSMTDINSNPSASATFAFLTAAAPDTSGPIYLSSLPVSGSTQVSTNGVTFYAYFNEPLLDTSITTSAFIMRKSGAAASTMVAGTAQINVSDPKVAQFDPVSGALAVSAWYNVFLTPLIKDISTNAMPVSGKFSFLTAGAPPPTAPVVSSSVPASGSVGVSVSSNLTVTMDKICSGGAGTITPVMSILCSGVVFAGVTTFDTIGSKTFTFNPTNNLAFSMPQTLRVSGIKDTGGLTMTPTNITFTTGDPPAAAPLIASSVPASGSSGISVSSNLTVTMDSLCSGGAGAITSVLSVICSGVLFSGTNTFDTLGQKTFQLDPATSLAYAMPQTLRVSGIYGLGGTIMTPVDISFTTDAAPPPPAPPVVASTNPASGSAGFAINSDLSVTMDKVCSGVTASMPPVISVITISGVVFNGTVTFDTAGKKTFTLNPTSDLRYSTISTMRISGICDNDNNFMVPVNVPFTTADPALNSLYSVSPTISTQQLDSNYFLIAEKRDTSNSSMDGWVVRQVKVYLKKTGSPNQDVKVIIRQNTEGVDTNVATIGTIRSTSLTTSFQQYTFTNLSNTYALTTNDAVGVWTPNETLGSATIGVQTGSDTFDGADSFLVKNAGGNYTNVTSQDLAGEMKG